MSERPLRRALPVLLYLLSLFLIEYVIDTDSGGTGALCAIRSGVQDARLVYNSRAMCI